MPLRVNSLRQLSVFFQNLYLDCKTVSFFLKISREIGKAWRKSIARAKRARLTCLRRIFSVSPQSLSMFSASFQTFCLTARPYLNTQKYGLFCSLVFTLNRLWEKNLVFSSIDYIWIACMHVYAYIFTCNSFKFLWKTVNSKPPTIPFVARYSWPG